MMYTRGTGVVQDHEQAVKWFRKAAQQGDAIAQFNLGGMYEHGKGVPQDYGETLKWFQKAAEQDYFMAQFKLGAMYENGRGVAQNYVMAHMWYNLAGLLGMEIAHEERDRIAEEMTPVQIAEAQRLAREWKPKKTD